MWNWKESVERCFFTDHLNERLKEFLNSQQTLSDHRGLWEFLFQKAWEWERKYSVEFSQIRMPSFFRQWHIDAYWGIFSFPDCELYSPEEILYWSFLTAWVQHHMGGYGKGGNRAPDQPLAGLDWLFRAYFRYPQETCTWLDRQQFLAELKNIYNRSEEMLQYYRKDTGYHNLQWMCDVGSGCSEFFNYYAFCEKNLQDPAIVRLNEFEPNRYVSYCIRDGSALHFLRLCDFG